MKKELSLKEHITKLLIKFTKNNVKNKKHTKELLKNKHLITEETYNEILSGDSLPSNKEIDKIVYKKVIYEKGKINEILPGDSLPSNKKIINKIIEKVINGEYMRNYKNNKKDGEYRDEIIKIIKNNGLKGKMKNYFIELCEKWGGNELKKKYQNITKIDQDIKNEEELIEKEITKIKEEYQAHIVEAKTTEQTNKINIQYYTKLAELYEDKGYNVKALNNYKKLKQLDSNNYEVQDNLICDTSNVDLKDTDEIGNVSLESSEME